MSWTKGFAAPQAAKNTANNPTVRAFRIKERLCSILTLFIVRSELHAYAGNDDRDIVDTNTGPVQVVIAVAEI